MNENFQNFVLLLSVISPQVLLVGLGGGPLAAFINHHFPKVSRFDFL